MTIDEISAALRDRILAAVSDATGIHRHTLRAIRDGKVRRIHRRTMDALSVYLDGEK